MRELNPTFPVGSKHAPHFQSSRAVMHEKVKNIPIDLPSIMHEKVKNSPTDLQNYLRGVRTRRGVKGFLVEIRPQRWKKTIWLGTHDAVPLYFPPLPSHLAVPPVEDSSKSESNTNELIVFCQKQAAKAAEMALDDREWCKRTYDEWCLQVMWFKVCRIFWLWLLHIYYGAISSKHSKVEVANYLHVIKRQSYFGIPFDQWLLIHL